MLTITKKLAKRSKGMEALQAVLLLGAAFFIIMALKNLATDAKGQAGGKISENMSATSASSQTTK